MTSSRCKEGVQSGPLDLGQGCWVPGASVVPGPLYLFVDYVSFGATWGSQDSLLEGLGELLGVPRFEPGLATCQAML